jgi:hypothetical protein
LLVATRYDTVSRCKEIGPKGRVKLNGKYYSTQQIVLAVVVAIVFLGGVFVLVGVVAVGKGTGRVAPPINSTGSGKPSTVSNRTQGIEDGNLRATGFENKTTVPKYPTTRRRGFGADGAYGTLAIVGAAVFGCVVLCIVGFRYSHVYLLTNHPPHYC